MEYHPYRQKIVRLLPILAIVFLAVVFCIYGVYLFPTLFNKNKDEGKIFLENAGKSSSSVLAKKLSPTEEKVLQQKMADLILTGDPEKCDEIQNEIYRTACRNNIFLKKIDQSEDVSLCQKMDDELISVESCERQIVFRKALEKEDIGVCLEATNELVRNECQKGFWTSMALKKNNRSVCEIAKYDTERKDCLDVYLFHENFKTHPIEFDCSQFNDSALRSDCFQYQTNRRERKENACENVSSSLFSQFCLSI